MGDNKIFSYLFSSKKNVIAKLLHAFLSFMLIFTLVFVVIETIDSEPAFASGTFDCIDSDGRTYLYQSTWSSGTLTINRGVNNDSGNWSSSVIETFSSWDLGNIEEVNSLSITTDGEMYAILKRTNTSQVYLYKLNYNSSGAGTTTRISSIDIGTGDNNAASNYEVDSGGTTYKYIFTSKGFFNGNQKVIRINGDGSYKVITPTITNGGNGSNKAKDFAWVSNHPSGNDFVGYDSNANDLLGAEITSHTNIGSDSEAITIDLSVINGNIGSGIGSNSGAAMSLGNGDVYFLENSTGDLWLYDQSAGSLTETNDDFSSSSNTDGAGCGIGLQGGNEFVPTLSTAQGTCDGSDKTVAVTLNNSGSDVAANYVVTYTIGGTTSNLSTGTSVNGGSNGSLSVPAQANGTTVQVNWYAESTTYGLRTPSSNTSSDTITVDASDCAGITVVTAINACSNGTATSKITITAAGSTHYVDVQYKIGSGGSWVTLEDGNSIAAGDGNAETYTTPSQNDGTTIYWQYRSSTSGNPSSGSYTSATSRTVDCDLTVTISTQINTCSNGTATTTVTFIGSASGNTQYYDLQRRENGGSWVTTLDGQEITAGETNTHTSSAFNNGTLVEWQYRIGDSNPSSGSYATTGTGSGSLTARTIDCDITFTITTSINSCSNGAATVSIAFAASASGNTQYLDVQWSTDGSTWENLADGGDLTAGDTDTYTTTAVNDGVTVYFQYRYGDSNPSSGSFSTANVTNRTVDCDLVITGSSALNTCSNGTNTATISLAATAAGNNQFIDVQYSINGGSSWSDLADGYELTAGETKTYTTPSQNDGVTISFRYRYGDSDPSSGSYTAVTSQTVDCDLTITATTSLNTCSNGTNTATISLEASAAGNTQYIDVDWSTDGSSWTSLADGVSIAAGETKTYTTTSQNDGTTIQFRYRQADSNPSSGSYTSGTSRTVDCDLTLTAATSLNSCSSGAATGTIIIEASAAGNTQYLDVQWSINGSSWTNLADGAAIAAGETKTYTTPAQSDGATIQFQYRYADSNPSSGSYTSATSRTVDCDPSTTVVNPPNITCSSGQGSVGISITNNEFSSGNLDLTSSLVLLTSTDEIVISSTEYAKIVTGDPVTYTQGSSGNQGNLTDGTTYYLIKSGTSNRMKLATSSANAFAGTAIDLTAVASGGTAHTFTGPTVYYKVEYRIDSGSWNVKNSNLSVNAGVTNTSLSQNVSNGSRITWRITDSFESGDFTNMSVETQTQSAVVDCAVDSTISVSFTTTCTNGARTSTISITNNESSTAYYLVEYQIDSGTFQTANSNLSVNAGATDTSLTQSVADGEAITWRIKDSLASGDFEGVDYETQSALTADCDPASTVSASFTSTCSSGARTSTISIKNDESVTAYYKVEYKIDSGSWQVKSSNLTVSGGATNTSITENVNDGSTITWRITDSFTDDNYTNMTTETENTSSQVDCDPATTISSSFGSCDSGSRTSTLSLGNDESVTAYYKVEYKIDLGSYQTASSNLSVSSGVTNTSLSVSVTAGSTITWRITDSFTSNDFTNMTTETQSGSTASTCTTTTTTTTTTSTSSTTTTTTTTTTLPEDPNKFLPIIFNQRNCLDEGGANYGLSMNNTNSNVAAQFTIRIFINNKRVKESAYTIPAGSSRFITTISGVPEGAKYKARIITRDALGSNKSVGKFKKMTNCIEELSTTTTIPDLRTTSTTLPLKGPITGVESSVSTTTTTIVIGELSLTDNIADDIISIVDGGNNQSPPSTLGPIQDALTKKSSVLVNNEVDESVTVAIQDVSEVTISNDEVSLSIALTCTIGCDDEEVKSNKFVTLTNSAVPLQVLDTIVDEPDAVIKGELDGEILIEATGFEPNSYVEVYMFSEPTFVGVLQADENGNLNGNLPTPDLEPGIHTLQALGTSDNGDDVVSNVKVELVDVDEIVFTNTEGNDYVAWDFNVDDNYVKDQDYLVQYYYVEDQSGLANTGFNLNYYGIGAIASLIFGFLLFTTSRKKRLINKETTLDTVYKSIDKLKSKVEYLIKENVDILINFEKINPYNRNNKSLGTEYENLNSLNFELVNLTISVNNIIAKTKNEGRNISKEEIVNIIELIGSEKIVIKFTGKPKVDEIISDENEQLSQPKNKRTKKGKNRVLTSISIFLMLGGLIAGGYTFNEMYLSNIKQATAQEYLASVYINEDAQKITSPVEESKNRLLNLDSLLNDVPVFEGFLENLTPQDINVNTPSTPNVFGYLEIEAINLTQYVVSGTNDRFLEYGPGHYLSTGTPGNGRNVGIAGHRTTYGAPFRDLDYVNLGDAIQLTIDSSKFFYVVDQIDIVDAIGGEYVLYDRGDDRLTLTTCHPKYSASQRLIVSAILVKIESVN